MLGFSESAFTQLHTIISLVGIASGLLVLFGMLKSSLYGGWTALFLATTILTSVTGFMFPRDQILPSHIFGAISLVLLAIAAAALYRYRLAASWRWIYVVTAIASLYLNVFVAIVQSFLKLPPLQPLAPTQSEPPFLAAQGVTLLVFIAAGWLALRAFHPASAPTNLRTA